MNKFTCVNDIGPLDSAVEQALKIKSDRFAFTDLGRNKTLLMIFFNSSLRTRLSTQKAAMNLRMNVMVLDVNQGAWKLETERGVVMDGDKAEHLLEAIPVMASYCDIIGVRSFASLADKKADYEERVLEQFIKYSGRPVFSMEAATRHPLQSFADLITIEEFKTKERPKVVMTWAPHPKALPQAVPNSFAEWMNATEYEFVITHPRGYELDPIFSGNARIEHDQRKALEGADFVYAKNWSAYSDPNYGKVLSTDREWTVDSEKMGLTDNAFFMHCLPVRRNMIVTDDVIESDRSIVIPEAANREISRPDRFVAYASVSITHFMSMVNIVKIGGNIIDDPEKLKSFLSEFSKIKGKKILVHGGGKEASRLSRRLGTTPKMIDGRRVTDKDTLDTVTMVYAGLINKRIVALLQSAGCDAVGLSGADGNSIPPRRRNPEPIDYGFVGDIDPDKVNAEFIGNLLDNGIVPVFCAICHDEKGTLLNCNADSVASSVALASARLAPSRLTFCFEMPGVLEDIGNPDSVIRTITPDSFEELKNKGAVSDGMIPKLQNALTCATRGLAEVRICMADDILSDNGTFIRAL